MKKKYFPLFFIILAIIISVFCWDKIILNYEANTQSYGEYARNHYNAHNDTRELYDLKTDPLEKNNLVGNNSEIEEMLWQELLKIKNQES